MNWGILLVYAWSWDRIFHKILLTYTYLVSSAKNFIWTTYLRYCYLGSWCWSILRYLIVWIQVTVCRIHASIFVCVILGVGYCSNHHIVTVYDGFAIVCILIVKIVLIKVIQLTVLQTLVDICGWKTRWVLYWIDFCLWLLGIDHFF